MLNHDFPLMILSHLNEEGAVHVMQNDGNAVPVASEVSGPRGE